MTDGQSVEDFARVLEPMVAAGRVPAVVIVGTHSGGYLGPPPKGPGDYDGSKDLRSLEYVPGLDAKWFADHETFFVEEVPAWAEAALRGLRRPEGSGDLRQFQRRPVRGRDELRHPDIFGHVFGFSIAGDATASLPKTGKAGEPVRFYLAAGTWEVLYHRFTAKLGDAMKARGAPVTFSSRSAVMTSRCGARIRCGGGLGVRGATPRGSTMMRGVLLLAAGWGLVGSMPAVADDPARHAEFFEARVRPILVEHCIACHGPRKQESGLRLDSRAGLLKGNDAGPVVVPGQPEESPLIEAVRHDGAGQDAARAKLPDRAIADLPPGSRWAPRGRSRRRRPGCHGLVRRARCRRDRRGRAAALGVPARRRPHAPGGPGCRLAADPIDRFILARLEAEGLAPRRPPTSGP